MTTYYKVLNNKREPVNGGHGKWLYRKWVPPVRVDPCNSGYHVCTRKQLAPYLHEAIWEVEIRGKVITQSDKIIASEARLIRKIETWNRRTQCLFACDCAEHVLKYALPADRATLKTVIDTSRRYINDNATDKELAAAARETAAAAWMAAAWTKAAMKAAKAMLEAAAWMTRAARETRKTAAWAARAVLAAREAAAAAWDEGPEYEWQTQRLFEYLDGKRK